MLKFAYKDFVLQNILLTPARNMAAPVGSLEEAARQRRERLKALKGKRGGNDDSGPPGKKGAGESEEKLPK